MQAGIARQQMADVHRAEVAFHGFVAFKVMIAVVAVHLPVAAGMRNEQHGLFAGDYAMAGNDAEIFAK